MPDNRIEGSERAHGQRHSLRGWPAASGYFVLAVAGLIGTWYFNIQWTGANGGFDLNDYITGWFANSASSSASIDLLVMTVAACIYVWRDRHSLGSRSWPLILIPLSFLIAVSFTFPLFLGLRELRRNRNV